MAVALYSNKITMATNKLAAATHYQKAVVNVHYTCKTIVAKQLRFLSVLQLLLPHNKCYIATCIIILFCNLSTTAQTIWPIEFKQKISGNFTQVYTDNLQNIYTVTATNQIKKYTSSLDSVAVYNNLTQYGNISLVDVTNGLKILVYYKDFATINILDRFLKPVSTIPLRKQNILQASVVALSYDGQIWLFDELTFQLKKIDETGKTLLETPDCRLLFNNFKAPEKIIDVNGLLYLYEPTTGFLVFDYYGAFKQQLSYTNWQQMQYNNGWFWGINNNTLIMQHLKMLKTISYTLPAEIEKSKRILIQHNRCIVLQPNSVDIYKIIE